MEVQFPIGTGAQSVAFCFDMDAGPLAIPDHIKIGGLTWDGHIIEHYGEMVDEYAVWLEDQIKAQNPDVLKALDDIYNMALGSGVILTTRCLVGPFSFTHAHVVKRTINSLI